MLSYLVQEYLGVVSVTICVNTGPKGTLQVLVREQSSLDHVYVLGRYMD